MGAVTEEVGRISSSLMRGPARAHPPGDALQASGELMTCARPSGTPRRAGTQPARPPHCGRRTRAHAPLRNRCDAASQRWQGSRPRKGARSAWAPGAAGGRPAHVAHSRAVESVQRPQRDATSPASATRSTSCPPLWRGPRPPADADAAPARAHAVAPGRGRRRWDLHQQSAPPRGPSAARMASEQERRERALRSVRDLPHEA